MTENAKTVTFVAVAVAVVLVAFVTRPSLPVSTPDDARGKPLYPDFKDPLAVTSLEIVEFDEATATVRPFQVAQVDIKGKMRWAIPSHDDYPADAKDQMASAAAALMGLVILEQTSDNRGDQELYGVVDPDPKVLKVGATGVGEKVVMKGADNKELLALVIGKEVPDRPGLRYVRKVNQDQIYVVSLKTDKLSTKFEDWIERNLLGINTFDMKDVLVRDYSVDLANEGLAQRGRMTLGYDDAGNPKWKLVEDEKFQSEKWTPVKMTDDEELNIAKLDELKLALDDLKIVDISRKPAGLSANLKATGDFGKNNEAVVSLASRGFYVAKLRLPSGEETIELFSNDGEVRLVMKDGLEYVLRFGNVTSAGDKSKKDEKEPPKEDEKKDKSGPGLNRYLFVMAEFNPAAVAKPQIEPLPEAKTEEPKKDADAKPAEEKKPAEADKKAGEKAETAKPEEKVEGDKKAEEKAPEDPKALEARRAQVEKDNKRKQEEYEQRIADGKKKVADLNARFADWYYIISDDVYRKIHLSHDDIVKKKAKDEKNGEHAGHDHDVGDAAIPTDELDKLKGEGPAGK